MAENNVTNSIISSSEVQLLVKEPDPNANPPILPPLSALPSQHYSEARFLYRFLYLRSRESFMIAYFQRQTPLIDKFCTFHTYYGPQECTQFVVHLPLRGRPSVFKSLPEDGLIHGPLSLRENLKDFAAFYQNEDGYRLHDNSEFKKPIDPAIIHDTLMERITAGTQSLAQMFFDAVNDVNLQVRSYILQNYAYYRQEEELTQSMNRHELQERFDPIIFDALMHGYDPDIQQTARKTNPHNSHHRSHEGRGRGRKRASGRRSQDQAGVEDYDDCDDDDDDDDDHDDHEDEDEEDEDEEELPRSSRRRTTTITQQQQKKKENKQPHKTLNSKKKHAIPVDPLSVPKTSKPPQISGPPPTAAKTHNSLPVIRVTSKRKQFRVDPLPMQKTIMELTANKSQPQNSSLKTQSRSIKNVAKNDDDQEVTLRKKPRKQLKK